MLSEGRSTQSSGWPVFIVIVREQISKRKQNFFNRTSRKSRTNCRGRPFTNPFCSQWPGKTTFSPRTKVEWSWGSVGWLVECNLNDKVATSGLQSSASLAELRSHSSRERIGNTTLVVQCKNTRCNLKAIWACGFRCGRIMGGRMHFLCSSCLVVFVRDVNAIQTIPKNYSNLCGVLYPIP